MVWTGRTGGPRTWDRDWGLGLETSERLCQHDLPDDPAGFELGVRLRGVFEREGSMNDRSHLATAEQRPDGFSKRSRNQAFLFRRTRAERRPEDREALLQDRSHVDVEPGTAHQADLNQPSVERRDIPGSADR